LLLVDVVPAWSTNLLKRLVRAPKRYLRDTGLAAAVLDVGTDDVLRNGDILGRMIETFVLAQLRAELPLYDQPPRLYHLRQEGGAREIDLIAELGLRRVIGLEIKARSAPSAESARHLVWLRDQLGDTFVAGLERLRHCHRHAERSALPIRGNGVVEKITSTGTSKYSAIRSARYKLGLYSPRSK
jgi:predicted AAA+ superfamily ATPase